MVAFGCSRKDLFHLNHQKFISFKIPTRFKLFKFHCAHACALKNISNHKWYEAGKDLWYPCHLDIGVSSYVTYECLFFHGFSPIVAEFCRWFSRLTTGCWIQKTWIQLHAGLSWGNNLKLVNSRCRITLPEAKLCPERCTLTSRHENFVWGSDFTC